MTDKLSGFGIGEISHDYIQSPGAEESTYKILLSQTRPSKLVKCSCGHTIPEELVMTASLGSACPDCFDKMSDCW